MAGELCAGVAGQFSVGGVDFSTFWKVLPRTPLLAFSFVAMMDPAPAIQGRQDLNGPAHRHDLLKRQFYTAMQSARYRERGLSRLGDSSLWTTIRREPSVPALYSSPVLIGSKAAKPTLPSRRCLFESRNSLRACTERAREEHEITHRSTATCRPSPFVVARGGRPMSDRIS